MCAELLCHSLTSEALATLAGETIELVNACASILTGTWQTVVPVQVTVLSHPSRLTVTAVTGKIGVPSLIQKESSRSNNKLIYKLKPVVKKHAFKVARPSFLLIFATHVAT